jgi:hypothetical protein
LQDAHYNPVKQTANHSAVQILTSQKADAGVIYKISYDLVTAEFIPDVLARANNAKQKGDGFVLDNYERVRQSVTIDDNGNLRIVTEWPDGDADMNMPAEVYHRTAHLMPAPAHDYKPVAKSEMANGFIRYYSAGGEILREYAVDESQFRVESNRIRELLAESRKPLDINERISQVLSSLNKHGGVVRRVNHRYAEISATKAIPAGVIHQKQVVDLTLGVVVRSEERGPGNRLLNREFMNYAKTDNIPVLKNSVIENYGERNGSWGLSSRKIINRDNFELFVNEF